MLTAVDGFSLHNPLATSPSEDVSEEEIQGHWDIKARNELIVTHHQSSSSSSSDDEEGKDEKDTKKKKNSKGKNLQEEQEYENTKQQREVPEPTKNFNPFADCKDVFKGQKTNLVILPKFPKNHQFAPNQR